MIGKLTRLPFRVAHKVARRIQEREEQRLAELHAAEAESAPSERAGPAIPAHELAELSSDEVSLAASEVLGGDYGLVDVRRAASGPRPAVEGATRIPLEELMIRLAELPAGARLVTLDDTGADALTAALFLRSRGFDAVFALRGGLGAWRAAGGEATGG